MELFSSSTLNKEYKELVNEILPKVLECSYCNISSCKHHKKKCRQLHCRSCFAFNISRNVLLEAADDNVNNYLNCFIVDFLNLSDESIKQFFPDIKIETLKREKLYFKKSYVKSEKNRSQVVNQTFPTNIQQVTFQHGQFKRRVFCKI